MIDAIPRDETARPFRVLLAEAGAHVRECMEEMLQAQDFEVVNADDGFEVLCRLPEWRPDLLLIASELPRLSGTQVCSLIRQCPDFSSLPVILMGKEHSLLDQAQADMAGANGCLPLPFRMDEFRQALSVMSQNPAQRNETAA
ncbi:hypothetical protein PHACT_07175 [Pseudohongiella acticola]|uniref:Response regulatory domain-containing protein n=1 Tax=Pseudohongiella acticola TaxID=1524254 RepID=A0A1E8CL09_9GAMM|nr:response regulator [Pseudohongiella acticola]OFE12947.1 hypothetical protein PHACT_07175 [Pseudohongiella acticola]